MAHDDGDEDYVLLNQHTITNLSDEEEEVAVGPELATQNRNGKRTSGDEGDREGTSGPQKKAMVDFKQKDHIFVINVKKLNEEDYEQDHVPAGKLLRRSKRLRQMSGVSIKTKEVEPRTLEMYLHLVFENEIAFCDNGDNLKNGEKMTLLVKLYLWACRLQDTKSINDVIEGLAKMLDEGTVSPQPISYAYEQTAEASPLRRLFVDFAVKAMEEVRFKKLVS